VLDDADAGRLAIAALVAIAGIAAILVFVLYRVLSAAKRARIEAARQYRPGDVQRHLRREEPREPPQRSNQSKIEPRLSWDEDDPEDPPLDPRQPEPDDRDRRAAPARRSFGFGALTLTFVFGIFVGVFAPAALQSVMLSSYFDQVQSVGGLRPSSDPSSSDAALSGDDLAELQSVRRRLPFEVNPGIEMVDVGIVDGFVDARIKVSRTLSANERKLFFLTAIDRAIHSICQVQANADLRALTDRGYDVRVTYVDNTDERIRRDILASPICPQGTGDTNANVVN
jgi:hypothetical protein